MASPDPLAQSWTALAGTALSGLGMTLHGVNTLNALASQAEGVERCSPAVAGGIVSGAIAIISSCWGAAKLGSVGSALSISTVGVGAGCAYASVGFLYFMYAIARMSAVLPPRHAPPEGSDDARLYPTPSWLTARVLNWGVMGRGNVGKSTLINSIRGLHARSPEAAPVGVGHTTLRPKPYSFVGEFATLTRNMARLWDLPGASTKDWPISTYVRDAGLRHFDGVLFVTSDAFSEAEVALISQLVEFGVPYYIVRNKLDQDILNNAHDNNATTEETLAEVRRELFGYGCDPKRTFLISAKRPDCADLDFGMLLRVMAMDVTTQRVELPEFSGEPSSSVVELTCKEERVVELGGLDMQAPATCTRGGSGSSSQDFARRPDAFGGDAVSGDIGRCPSSQHASALWRVD